MVVAEHERADLEQDKLDQDMISGKSNFPLLQDAATYQPYTFPYDPRWCILS